MPNTAYLVLLCSPQILRTSDIPKRYMKNKETSDDTTEKIEKSIARQVYEQEIKGEKIDKGSIQSLLTDAGYIAEDWQLEYASERVITEVEKIKYNNSSKEKPEKNQQTSYLGWVLVIASFIKAPIGAICVIPLAIYIIISKKHNTTLGIISLIFSISIICILLFFMFIR